MFTLLPKILSGILLHIVSKLVTEKFFSALVESLVTHALEYLLKKDLLKNTKLDEDVIKLLIDNLKE